MRGSASLDRTGREGGGNRWGVRRDCQLLIVDRRARAGGPGVVGSPLYTACQKKVPAEENVTDGELGTEPLVTLTVPTTTDPWCRCCS